MNHAPFGFSSALKMPNSEHLRRPHIMPQSCREINDWNYNPERTSLFHCQESPPPPNVLKTMLSHCYYGILSGHAPLLVVVVPCL